MNMLDTKIMYCYIMSNNHNNGILINLYEEEMNELI